MKEKKCPACSLYRTLFVGKICILCHRANKRAEEEDGNWCEARNFKKSGLEVK